MRDRRIYTLSHISTFRHGPIRQTPIYRSWAAEGSGIPRDGSARCSQAPISWQSAMLAKQEKTVREFFDSAIAASEVFLNA